MTAKNKNAYFQLRLEDTILEKARVVSESKGISIAGLFRWLVLEEIKVYEEKNGEIKLPEKEASDV
jgi:predicted site-specific integrase-resolvase